ncbi:ribosomal protein L11 methyltransferase [Candidatus Endobugula sertula]|uniref:Ribosomal protein L11 methyltransferase n=1 Tax=Candidatus Endobugula sertula TaxID=62101 RepID=A0A1D2QT86_9GAMM|nr:ribosomal protein L11 methyltransferase [Candidatus Endobugula sertula]
MPWLQLSINTNKSHTLAIEDALLNAGAASITFKEHIPFGESEKPILEPGVHETPLWNNTRIIGLFNTNINIQSVNWILDQHLNKNHHYHWEPLEDKDWEREWIKNYQPIQCADTLWVCPSWIEPPDPEATNVLLDPGLAFGTGTHPTTFLCMQWLATQACSDIRVVDYGCGSGILGIAALLLGAKQAVGIDIDPQALLATQNNLQRNHLSTDKFTVYPPENCPQTTADIVLANILAGPLVELAETIINLVSPNGKICLSGILSEQAQSVINAYSHVIHFDPIAYKEEWVRLSGRRL